MNPDQDPNPNYNNPNNYWINNLIGLQRSDGMQTDASQMVLKWVGGGVDSIPIFDHIDMRHIFDYINSAQVTNA